MDKIVQERSECLFCKRWRWFFIYCALLYISLPWAPMIWSKLIAILGRPGKNLPFITLAAAFIFINLVFLRLKKHTRLLGPAIMVLVFVIFYAIIKGLKLPAERMHVLEYGLLAAIIFYALKKEQNAWLIYTKILFIGAAVGLFDEVIQYFLPNRVFDLRDIAVNALSVLLGAVIVYCFKHLP
jgi:hypothetical protein